MASTVINSGLKAADKYTIRIPQNADAAGAAYVEPLSYAGAASTWTLRNGDIICKGDASSVIAPTPAKLQALYPMVTILGVTDNRRAPNAPHWRVVGA